MSERWQDEQVEGKGRRGQGTHVSEASSMNQDHSFLDIYCLLSDDQSFFVNHIHDNKLIQASFRITSSDKQR